MTALQSPFARFTLVMIGVVLVVGALLTLAFHGPGDSQAIWTSAGVAIVVQLIAFAVGQSAGKVGLSARMGAGALVRFLALVFYAFLVALVLKLPVTAALISLFLFFFLSTLIEPLLIRS